MDSFKKKLFKIKICLKYIRQKFQYRKIRKSKGIIKEIEKDSRLYFKSYTNKYNKGFATYYSTTSQIKDYKYIPDDLYYSYIDEYLNDSGMSKGIDNKSYYPIIIKNIKQPLLICNCMCGILYDIEYNILGKKNYDLLYRLLKDNYKYIIKPSINSQGGKGICVFEKHNMSKIKDTFEKNNDFVIQEFVIQHEDLAKIHNSSLNTIRITTLLINSNVEVLSSVLRMGINNNQVDNASSGGIFCGISPNGTLKKFAYDNVGNKYIKHPNTNFYFENFPVPLFDNAITLVKKEAERYPYFRLISWDIAISQNNEPIFIEFNLKNGQLNLHQFTNGPLFGIYTDQVLDEVFIK